MTGHVPRHLADIYLVGLRSNSKCGGRGGGGGGGGNLS